MLIMTLSYTQKSNDKTLISKYVIIAQLLVLNCTVLIFRSQFNLLDQWTQFLITDSLIPANQISTDDFAGSLANQTNLAIKGIIGIKAMAAIADLVGDSARSSNYSVRWTSENYNGRRLRFYDRTLHRLTFSSGRNLQHLRLANISPYRSVTSII